MMRLTLGIIQIGRMVTKLENIEKDYWWEIKSYLENPSKEALVGLLELVYEDGYMEAAAEYGEGFTDD